MQRLLLLCCALVLLAAPAFGDSLTFTLNPSVQIGLPGGAAIYQGTIDNPGPSDLFLDDISIIFTPPGGTYLDDDSNFFFANVPGTFLVIDLPYIGPIFRITIAPNTPAGMYFGSVTLLGSDGFSVVGELGSQNFELNVGGVPEPASLVLIATGLASLLGYGWWHRQRAAGDGN